MRIDLRRWRGAPLWAALMACLSAPPVSAGAPTVLAAGEQLEGVALTTGGAGYFGIPYAAPPVGERRWRAPQPPVPRVGRQDATHFGAACPQDQGNARWYRQVATAFGASADVVPDLAPIAEDCLFLNVWAPAPADRAPAGGWPVLVWIHGGSNANGYSHEPNYRGAALARRGVLVVTLNYRLGTFGFLRHPALGVEASGRQGLLDQVQALRWIQSHIGVFGGDARNVTIAGESAGGANVYFLLRMPEARGLFHKAIIQSGSMRGDRTLTAAAAERAATTFFTSLGATDADAMRALPWQRIVAAQTAWPEGSYYAPVMDVRVAAAAVPMLIGTNLDEWRMYLPTDVAKAYEDALRDLAGEQASSARSYLTQASEDLRTRSDRLISGQYFHCPARDVASESAAAGAPTFAYLFTRVRPGEHGLGAYHGAEIPYVFETPDRWLAGSATDRGLSRRMAQYWVNFARRGDPNGPGLARWPRYTAGATPFELGTGIGPARADVHGICRYLRDPASGD